MNVKDTLAGLGGSPHYRGTRNRWHLHLRCSLGEYETLAVVFRSDMGCFRHCRLRPSAARDSKGDSRIFKCGTVRRALRVRGHTLDGWSPAYTGNLGCVCCVHRFLPRGDRRSTHRDARNPAQGYVGSGNRAYTPNDHDVRVSDWCHAPCGNP